jgi:exodeoxyribonuclease V beta subunit
VKRFDLATSALGRGTTLLEASAGTGKTYTITGIVLRLLLEDVVDALGQVLVVTFTVAATEELKTRLRRALGVALQACEGRPVEDAFVRGLGAKHGAAGARKLRAALASIDELSVATIHGFCLRVLTEAAFESGTPFRTEFVEDELPLLVGAARDAVRLCIGAGDAYSAAVLRHAGLLPDELARQYRAWRLHAGTRLLPEPPPLESALADLRAAAARARAAFAPELVGFFARLPFKAHERSPVLDAGAGFGRELQRRLQDPDDACVEWLCQLAPSRLDEQLYKRGRPPLDQPFFAACEAAAGAMAAAELALRQALFRALHARLLGQKQRGRSLTFQDLLEQVHAALHDPARGRRLLAAVRARWQAALIDEFQDTDPLQYGIFAACFADRRLFLVGDCKQSIYGERAATRARTARWARTTAAIRGSSAP